MLSLQETQFLVACCTADLSIVWAPARMAACPSLMREAFWNYLDLILSPQETQFLVACCIAEPSVHSMGSRSDGCMPIFNEGSCSCEVWFLSGPLTRVSKYWKDGGHVWAEKMTSSYGDVSCWPRLLWHHTWTLLRHLMPTPKDAKLVGVIVFSPKSFTSLLMTCMNFFRKNSLRSSHRSYSMSVNRYCGH